MRRDVEVGVHPRVGSPVGVPRRVCAGKEGGGTRVTRERLRDGFDTRSVGAPRHVYVHAQREKERGNGEGGE